MSVEPVLKVSKVSYHYNSQAVLSDVSFEIFKGDYFGLIGPNGGGKTTLIKLILGILPLQTGQVLIQGSADAVSRRKIGYVPQRLDSLIQFPASVSEVIESGFLGEKKYQKERLLEVLKTLEIQHLQNRLMGQLSGGERQKVYIARSLINDPEILILDEPTVAIDQLSEHKFYSTLSFLNKTLGKTILLVSHDIAVLTKEVDKIIFLNQKVTCFHAPEEFLNPQNLQELYGKESHLLNSHNHSHNHV